MFPSVFVCWMCTGEKRAAIGRLLWLMNQSVGSVIRPDCFIIDVISPYVRAKLPPPPSPPPPPPVRLEDSHTSFILELLGKKNLNAMTSCLKKNVRSVLLFCSRTEMWFKDRDVKTPRLHATGRRSLNSQPRCRDTRPPRNDGRTNWHEHRWRDEDPKGSERK